MCIHLAATCHNLISKYNLKYQKPIVQMLSDHNDKMVVSHMPACRPNVTSVSRNDGVSELTICIRVR